MAPLRKLLQLKGVTLDGRSAARPRRLGPLDLKIPARQKLLVVGQPGSGKSSLVEVLAARGPIDEGKILWDGKKLSKVPYGALREQVSVLESSPYWIRRRLSQVIDAQDAELAGLGPLLAELDDGAETSISAAELSDREVVRVAFAKAISEGSSLVLLDDPFVGLDAAESAQLLDSLFDRCSDATVVVTSGFPVLEDRFDRVLRLDNGQVVDDSAERSG